MPVEYHVFDDPLLAYIRYYGHVRLDEMLDALNDFSNKAAHLAGQPHLFDFSQIASYDVDPAGFLKFMARVADVYPPVSGQQLNVFLAPPGPASEMAEMARNPWEGSDRILIRVAPTWNQAFDVLGGERKDLLAHIASRV